MKARYRIFVVITLFIIGIALIPTAYAASYSLPQAWQIVYLNPDGSLDVYDYRHYTFNGGPPSSSMPYYLDKDFKLYDRTLSYPFIEAFALDTPLHALTKPTDIREKWNIIKSHLTPLEVYGSDGDFKIGVPDKDTLYLLVHYRVSPDITVVGKDFARTYYALPILGSSDVDVDTYYTAFILPQKVNCQGEPTYDEEDFKCPCFMVHRFIVSGSGNAIGKYYKGCDFVLFEAHNISVKTKQELDSVYPKSILSAYTLPPVDQSYAEVKKWQETKGLTPEPIEKGLWYSIFATVFLFVLAGFSGGRKLSAYKKYYLKQLKETPANMEMPHDDVYRSFFFTPVELNMALAKKDPYDIPSTFSKSHTPSDIERFVEKGGNAFRAIFFVLMQKGYIEPITDGDKLLGFKLQDSTTPLEEHEKLVWEKVKEAAKMNVEEKHGILESILGKKEDLAEVMNERDPNNILLPKEFEAYLKQDSYTVNLGNGSTATIPLVAQLGLDIMKTMIDPRDIPSPLGGSVPPDAPNSIKTWDKMGKIFAFTGIGFMMAAVLYFFISAIFYNIINHINIKLLIAMPLLLPFIFFILSLFIKGKQLDRWLNPVWWKEYLSWYSVEKWILQFTRITKKEISAYETLNWDKYYIFAALRGIESLLIKALKVSGIIKEREDIRQTFMYWMAADYMYRHTWNSTSYSFVSHYQSAYHKAHRSGSSSGGSSTGSSFGGGGGGGGGSTGW